MIARARMNKYQNYQNYREGITHNDSYIWRHFKQILQYSYAKVFMPFFRRSWENCVHLNMCRILCLHSFFLLFLFFFFYKRLSEGVRFEKKNVFSRSLNAAWSVQISNKTFKWSNPAFLMFSFPFLFNEENKMAWAILNWYLYSFDFFAAIFFAWMELYVKIIFSLCSTEHQVWRFVYEQAEFALKQMIKYVLCRSITRFVV